MSEKKDTKKAKKTENGRREKKERKHTHTSTNNKTVKMAEKEEDK